MSGDALPPLDYGVAYAGPQAWQQPLMRALRRVVDPELALSILDVGLVHALTVDDDQVRVRLTMTSPACPVTELILDDLDAELRRTLPPEWKVDAELVWDPPWSPARMSASARRFFG